MRALYDRAHPHEHSRAATVEEDWRLFQDGTVGAFKLNRLGHDVREITTLGPLTYERGVVRGVHWEKNRNGIVFTYPGVHDARDQVSDRAFLDAGDDRDVRLLGDSLGTNSYVVEVNPPGGRRVWLYIDKRTGFLTRKEWIARRRRYTTSYDDYRLVEGVPEPSRVRTVDSLGNEREQILVTRMLDATPDPRDVEIPASRRVLEFPEKQTAVRLPVRMVNGLAIVRVIVGRGAYDFLLDSGAAGIVLDPAVLEQQGLERLGARIGSTLGSFPESTTIVPQMTIGGLRMRNVVSRVVTIPFRPDERTRVMGLLGFDFFADAVVHVNLDREIVEAIVPERFRAPADASTIPVALDDKTPAVRMRVGTGSGRVVIDTGANRSIFETAFAERADFAPDRSVAPTHLRGMGGYTSAEAARIPSFDLGGLVTRDAIADVANADLGTDDIDGIVGTDLLRGDELWFDYRTNLLHLRRTPPKRTSVR